MRLALITLAVAAAASAASTLAVADKASPLATPAPPSGTGLPTGQCIRSHDIRNHTVADRYTLLIDVNGQATYRITTKGACLAGAITSDPIITQEPPGTSIICKPIQMDLSISKGGMFTRCIVDSIVKMSPEEVAALPPKLKP